MQQKQVQRQEFGCLGSFIRLVLNAMVFRFITRRVMRWVNNRTRTIRRY
jgi:hypothetical protein